jgi:hypothetical protein
VNVSFESGAAVQHGLLSASTIPATMVSYRPKAAIQNLAKAKVNTFKDTFVQMNFGEELTSYLEIQVLNVIRIR